MNRKKPSLSLSAAILLVAIVSHQFAQQYIMYELINAARHYKYTVLLFLD